MESQVFQACTDNDLSTLINLIMSHRLNPDKVRESSGFTPLHLACKHGHLEITQYLITEQNCNPESTTPNCHTPLHTACKSGHLHIVKCLITEYKCNPHCTDSDGYTPLHAASESGNLDVVEYLITENSCNPKVSDSVGNTPLHYASESGCMNIVQYLILDLHCDPQEPNSRGRIPLHYACCGGALPVVKYLVSEHHCSPDHTDIHGNTPVHLACQYGHLATVKYLTNECKCNPLIVNSNGLTPLHYACLNGHLSIVRLLSQCNCNQHTCANNGNTPLHSACENGHLEVAKYLITEHICDPKLDNANGYTPLHSAARNGHLAVVSFFISEIGCNPNDSDTDGCTPLHYACHCGDLEVVKYLIDGHNCNPECQNIVGLTPLHYACLYGHLALAKYLICELSCNLQIVDHYGQTPLHLANWTGHLEIVTFLISECNCNPKCFDNNGSTPLHYACEFGHLEVAKYLITECRCSLEHGNVNGYTPLHLAAGNGHLAIIKCLIIEQTCISQSTERYGQTALHLASLGGHLGVIIFLFSEFDFDPECSDNTGTTPLHCACQEGHLEVAKYLITEHNCSPEHMNFAGLTPLYYACLYGHLAIVKYLVCELGCNLQISDQYGQTPLHLASWKGYMDIVIFLVSECNCDPDNNDNCGLTPLHYASANGHLHIVRYFVSKGNVNPQCVDNSGTTALHLACFNGHFDIVRFLTHELNCTCDPECCLNNELFCKNDFLSKLSPLNAYVLLMGWFGTDGLVPLHFACVRGNTDIAKYLITICNCNPFHPTNCDVTAIDIAQFFGHLEIVKLVSDIPVSGISRIMNALATDSDVSIFNDNYEFNETFTALHWACFEGDLEAVKLYINQFNIDPSSIITYDIASVHIACTPVHIACSLGHLDIVRYLITECGCDPNCVDRCGDTPLSHACIHGHLEVVKYLGNEHKSRPDHGNVIGWTPLHLAAEKGHLSTVKYCISELGCSPQLSDNDHKTPLHFACENGHLELAKYLIAEQKCSPEHGDKYGVTPLHSAALNGHLAVVKYLTSELGYNPQIGTRDGTTLLHYACNNSHLEVAKYLLNEHHISPEHGNVDGCTPLHSAARNGCLAIVEYLTCEVGCNPQITNEDMLTPLHYACIGGHLNIVKFLISKCNCHMECTDRDGATPLHQASANGHLHIMRYLISELNCNPQCLDNNGTTPLHLACASENLDVVKYLIQEQNCECDLECRIDKKLFSEFMLSKFENQPSISKQNIEFVMGLVVSVLEGITPLHFACMAGNTDIVKYLINICNCNLFHSTNGGLTPFDFAQFCGHVEIVKLASSIPESGISRLINTSMQMNLVDHCASINVDATFTPLHVACFVGNLEVVKLWIDQFHQDPSSKWILDITPLHIACIKGHLEIVKYLVTECECDPKCVGAFGETPLHYACGLGHLEVVKYLVTWYTCDPDMMGTILNNACFSRQSEIVRFLVTEFEYTQSNISWALLAACVSGEIDIFIYLIPECFGNLNQFLLPACMFGHLEIVRFLIEKCGFDANYTNDHGLTPLHSTCTDIEHLNAEKYRPNQDFQTNISSDTKKRGKFFHVWHAICYPVIHILQLIAMKRVRTIEIVPGASNCDISHTVISEHDNRSQLLKSSKIDIFKYLVEEHKCNIQCEDKDGHTPLHYACASGQLDIVRYIHMHCGEKLSDLVHTTHSGDTPLHIACKSNQVDITEFLLSTGQCNPLCKNAEGITPLEITTSIEIRDLLDRFCRGNYPLESVVKVFILGDSLAGKSSMVKALQGNPDSLSSLIGRRPRVKGVRQQTAGIDSLGFSSNDFGHVVLYDFAGQREFLTSHAAFLQNSSSQLAGTFIIVANIATCDDDVCQSLQYWVSFILDCCANGEIIPHIIFVGSHKDQLAKVNIDKKHSLIKKIFFSKQDSNQFYIPKGIVCLNCTRAVSPGLDHLRYYLKESCNSIREQVGGIDQRCYVLHRYVWKTYTSAGVQGCTLENICKDVDGNSLLLPNNPTELLPLFQTLHDKGQVLLLKKNQNLGESWVITDIAAVLENVIGSIFAPHNFHTHISLGSTGVVSKSAIREVFPDLNTDMIIGFLEHFEFCHRVEPDWIKLSGLDQPPTEITDDEYYLFPALVISDSPLHDKHESSYCCGWLLHSSVERQFFTSRFLHVLLLRLAFLFSQPQDDSLLSNAKLEAPAVRRRCKIWKNGITWHDANRISTLVEVRDLRSVVLSMTCMDDSRIHCVRLRSQLIQTVLKSKHQFCSRVLTEEFIVDVADDILLQAVHSCPSYSIKYLSNRISTKCAKDNPDLTLINPDGSQGKRISELLYLEPHALLTPDLIAKLFAKENAKQPVSGDFIRELAKWIYPFHDALLHVLEPSPRVLNEKYERICENLIGISQQQLKCEHIIETWVEQQGSAATYRNLRQELDRYSIFCGRNPLNLQIDESGDSSDDDGKGRAPQGDQDQPTWRECIGLQGLKRRINIPQEIGTNYKVFGTLLLEDRTGERVNAISHKHMNDAEKVNVSILEEWIAGKGKHPVTWKTLTETIRETELAVLAGEIEAAKLRTETQLSEVQGDQPTLIECVRFRGRERRINISQEIGMKYMAFGILLLQEGTGERVSSIAHKHMYDSEQTSLEILEEWIAGKGKHPVTWNTLIEVLHDIELSTLAREIEVVKPSSQQPH